MSDGTDSNSTDVTYFGRSRKAIIFEVARASYAVGIGTAVTTILVLGVSVIGIELPEIVLFAGFLIGLGFLPSALYLYDRYHERDFVIADLGHATVRPAALLYRILRGP
jgi:uncharacterized transporter YbjL